MLTSNANGEMKFLYWALSNISNIYEHSVELLTEVEQAQTTTNGCT